MGKDKDEDEFLMERVNFTLPANMKAYVESTAAKLDRSVSWIIREGIKAYAEQQGDKLENA